MGHLKIFAPNPLVKIRGSQRYCMSSILADDSTLVYEHKCGGMGCGVSANEYSCVLGAQINFGDLTPYLTSGKYLLIDTTFSQIHLAEQYL
jgi:hypothetical protein